MIRLVQDSLILGTLMQLASALWSALPRTNVGRRFDMFCRRVGKAWRASVLVSWFCSPRYAPGEAAAPGKLRARLCGWYQALGLKRLFSGSVFLQCFIWCALGVVAAPFAPTMLVLALALTGCASLALRLLHRPEHRVAPNPLAPPVLAFLAVYCVGVLTSEDRRGSLTIGILTVAFVLFSLALYHAVETRAQLELLLSVMTAVGALVSLYGILQYLFGWGYQSSAWVDRDMFEGIRFRVGSTLDNPNQLGQYLTLIIPVGCAKLLRADKRERWIYALCCALMGVCMVLTFSRGAWLGLLCALFLFVIVLQPRLLFLVPVGLILLYFILPDTVVSRFTSIGNLQDRSTSYRVSIWMGTIVMLRAGYWLTGIGPGEGAFNTIYPFYRYNASFAQHAHNLYLQMICDAGVAELAAFAWLVVRFFRSICAAIVKRTEDARLTQVAFLSGTAGFLVQAMTDYSFYNYRVMFLFWAYLALGMAGARYEHLRKDGIIA